MRVSVRAHTKSRREAVEEGPAGELRVYVKALPVGGAANAAIVSLLAKHFRVARSRVEIIRGKSAKVKVVDILL